MSKGLGKLQRRIIEAAGATQTVWDMMPVKFNIVHDGPMTAEGITVEYKDGWTWRGDGKPWYEATESVTSGERLKEILSAGFRSVRADYSQQCAHPGIMGAVWESGQIYRALYPDLFDCDDIFENVPYANKFGETRYRRMIMHGERNAKASAKASIARALSSMKERGLIVGTVSSYDLGVKSKWGVYLVTDDEAIGGTCGEA